MLASGLDTEFSCNMVENPEGRFSCDETLIDSVIDWFSVNKTTDSWLDGRHSVRFGLLLVYGLVTMH